MNDLAQLLSQTLADASLSGSEREKLQQWFAANANDDQKRGVARHMVFDVARGASLPVDKLLTWLEGVLKLVDPVRKSEAPGADSEAFFSPGEACLHRILHRINNCRNTMDLCVFTITDDRITRTILDAHRRRVKIRIVTDNDKLHDPGSDIHELSAAGIPLRIDRTEFHMHHKFAIFDAKIIINGSYNWTRGATQNLENLIDSTEGNLIAKFQHEFEAIWEKLHDSRL